MRAARRKAERKAPAARPARGPTPAPAQPLFLFLAEPGLGDLALHELKHLKLTQRKARPLKARLRNHDMLVLPGHLVEPSRARSRLCTNVLRAPIFGRGAVTPRQLDALAALCRRGGYKRIVSTVTGEAFARQDLLRWLTRELAARGVTLAASGRALWLIVVDAAFYLAEEIQNHHDAPGRGAASTRSGALPATIGAAMAFAAQLGEGEVVWDPVAGSGGLLAEVGALAPGARLLATDIDPAAVAALGGRFGPRAWCEIADAAGVALPGPPLTLTIANLPFGKRYAAQGGTTAFYADVIANALRHAGPGWRGVFLTSDTNAMRTAARGLSLTAIADLKIRGLPAAIWKVERP
ncbi:MAG TPA: hypothetical protein VKU90_16625 [Caulobacteraceae bacterium]|nr:hypothetical protein [Caulobacteraceae bacterium]